MATAATSILELFESSKNCDVKFKVRCGSTWCCFPAHRLVLSIWSPVLADKFKLNNSAFDGEIEIVDIRPSIFKAFLNYLYGSVQELKRNENDVKFVLDTYEAASKYQVQRLKTYCCEILNSSSPNKDNVFDLIDAALMINSNCLKERCYAVLQSETEAILNSQDIQTLTPSMVMTLLQVPSLWLSSEFELLTWVFMWARYYFSNQQNINNPREIISPFLPYLNFPVLESKDFAKLVNNYREFFDDVECFKIFMKINVPESTELPVWYDRSTNSRQYNKPAENVLLGDFAPELGYSVNNLASCHSDTSNGNVSIRLSDDNASTSLTVDKVAVTVDIGTNTTTINDTGSVDASTSNIYNKISVPTVEKMTQTEVATDANSGLANPFNGNSSVPLDVNISVISSFSTIDNETQTTDETTNINNKEDSSSDGNLSVPINDEISVTSPLPTVDNDEVDETMDTKSEEVTSSDDNSSKLNVEISTTLDDVSSMIEEIERGQKNSAVLEILNQESGKSWDSLEPPIHLEKIKKKKIKTVYLLPAEGKSLPNIGVWDSVFGPSFLSGDFKSLNSIIEKQQNISVAADILSRSFTFEEGRAPCIFSI